MATAKQIAANRRNAKKSTGPRTQQGKARSSRNAIRHKFAAPGWIDIPIGATCRYPDLSASENQQAQLFEKSMAVSNERTALVKKATDLFVSGDLQAGVSQMKRAVALERYNRRIDTRSRRLMKSKAETEP